MNKINFQNGTLVSKAKVTINDTVYEVEPAEYEGTTPLNAENLNQIQTNAENSINTVQSNLNTTNQNIEDLTTYSTTEQVIGRWIGGEPVYRKIYVLTINGTSATAPLNISNLSQIVMVYGGIVSGNDGFFPLPNFRISDSNKILDTEFYISQNTIFANIRSSTHRDGQKINVIVEYTKTTD